MKQEDKLIIEKYFRSDGSDKTIHATHILPERIHKEAINQATIDCIDQATLSSLSPESALIDCPVAALTLQEFKMIHWGEPDKIIEAACKTVGVSLDYIFKIISEKSEVFDNFNSISVGDWCCLCRLLLLDIGCISYGYSSYSHKRVVGKAIYEGNYPLPITAEVKVIWKSFKSEMKNQRKDQLKNYGENLKKKIQLDYLKEDLQCFFSYFTP